MGNGCDIEQFEKGKLYTIETKQGERLVVFRDDEGLRTNSHFNENHKTNPARRIPIDEVMKFEECFHT